MLFYTAFFQMLIIAMGYASDIARKSKQFGHALTLFGIAAVLYAGFYSLQILVFAKGTEASDAPSTLSALSLKHIKSAHQPDHRHCVHLCSIHHLYVFTFCCCSRLVHIQRLQTWCQGRRQRLDGSQIPSRGLVFIPILLFKGKNHLAVSVYPLIAFPARSAKGVCKLFVSLLTID